MTEEQRRETLTLDLTTSAGLAERFNRFLAAWMRWLKPPAKLNRSGLGVWLLELGLDVAEREHKDKLPPDPGAMR
jgi:hypothetical protein